MSVSEVLAATDEQLRHLERMIEHQRLQIAAFHPSQRMPQVRALQDLLNEYSRLNNTTADEAPATSARAP
jgi:hypothetical protein